MRTKKSVTLKNTKSIKTDHEIYYRAISGSISLVHSEPDGDSVHFIADNSKDLMDCTAST